MLNLKTYLFRKFIDNVLIYYYILVVYVFLILTFMYLFFYVTFDIIVKSHEQPMDVSAIEMFYWIMIVIMIMIISVMMMMMTIITWR